MTRLTAWLAASDRLVGSYAGATSRLLRWGLGFTIFLAGAHKLVAPAAWHAYLAPVLETAWPTGLVSLDLGFVLFGVSEVAFGLLLFADWHTPTVAGVTALSLAGVVANLLLAMGQGMAVGDVLVRDLGLTAFATAVALDAARDRSDIAERSAAVTDPPSPS